MDWASPRKTKSKFSLRQIFIFSSRNVLGVIDEETMPDYGHSKAYSLLPNYCPETDPINKASQTQENREERE